MTDRLQSIRERYNYARVEGHVYAEDIVNGDDIAYLLRLASAGDALAEASDGLIGLIGALGGGHGLDDAGADRKATVAAIAAWRQAREG